MPTIQVTVGQLDVDYDNKNDELDYDLNKKYQFIFEGDPSDNVKIWSEQFDKSEYDKICRAVIPFLVSRGKVKTWIPLIVNSYPEFAKYALEWTPHAANR